MSVKKLVCPSKHVFLNITAFSSSTTFAFLLSLLVMTNCHVALFSSVSRKAWHFVASLKTGNHQGGVHHFRASSFSQWVMLTGGHWCRVSSTAPRVPSSNTTLFGLAPAGQLLMYIIEPWTHNTLNVRRVRADPRLPAIGSS